jgi:hypothetical protein
VAIIVEYRVGIGFCHALAKKNQLTAPIMSPEKMAKMAKTSQPFSVNSRARDLRIRRVTENGNSDCMFASLSCLMFKIVSNRGSDSP